MRYPAHIWQQLKNISCDDLIRALNKDGWNEDISRGAVRVFRHSDGRRITIHYHPRKTYRQGLLQHLLSDIGWTESDFRRLKLIK